VRIRDGVGRLGTLALELLCATGGLIFSQTLPTRVVLLVFREFTEELLARFTGLPAFGEFIGGSGGCAFIAGLHSTLLRAGH
jgi:hypothetical protein